MTYIKTHVKISRTGYTVGNIGYQQGEQFDTIDKIYLRDGSVMFTKDPKTDKLIPWVLTPTKINASNQILPDSTYQFEMAFAMSMMKSRGTSVSVCIQNDTLTAIYEGVGKIKNAEPGDTILRGRIMEHTSGVWIVSNKESDTELDELSGCWGGPTIVDFKMRKIWWCD